VKGQGDQRSEAADQKGRLLAVALALSGPKKGEKPRSKGEGAQRRANRPPGHEELKGVAVGLLDESLHEVARLDAPERFAEGPEAGADHGKLPECLDRPGPDLEPALGREVARVDREEPDDRDLPYGEGDEQKSRHQNQGRLARGGAATSEPAAHREKRDQKQRRDEGGPDPAS
jgi:hypothetical protein